MFDVDCCLSIQFANLVQAIKNFGPEFSRGRRVDLI